MKMPPFDKEIKIVLDAISVQRPWFMPSLTHALWNITFEQVYVHKEILIPTGLWCYVILGISALENVFLRFFLYFHSRVGLEKVQVVAYEKYCAIDFGTKIILSQKYIEKKLETRDCKVSYTMRFYHVIYCLVMLWQYMFGWRAISSCHCVLIQLFIWT